MYAMWGQVATDEAMSPLRRRMIEDTTIRKLAPKTRQGYIRTVKDFVGRLLNATPGLKYIASLSVAYGAGLRARR
jgi:hypothetical protein